MAGKNNEYTMIKKALESGFSVFFLLFITEEEIHNKHRVISEYACVTNDKYSSSRVFSLIFCSTKNKT